MKTIISLQDVRIALESVTDFSFGQMTDYEMLNSDLQDDFGLDSMDIDDMVEVLEDGLDVVIRGEGIEWFSAHAKSVENFLQMVNDYQD